MKSESYAKLLGLAHNTLPRDTTPTDALSATRHISSFLGLMRVYTYSVEAMDLRYAALKLLDGLTVDEWNEIREDMKQDLPLVGRAELRGLRGKWIFDLEMIYGFRGT